MCRPAFNEKDSDKDNKSAQTTLIPNPAELAARETGQDEWLRTFDHNGFARDIRALGKELEAAQGPADVAHLNKMILWSNACAAIGLLTAGLSVNLVTIIALSLYTTTRWTMIAHHVCHGGYENCHPKAVKRGRWSRFTFAVGSTWRRFNDWFDWMMPEAWNVEHNNRHHYNLSELNDPDLLERNAVSIRTANMPMLFKYLQSFGVAILWKFTYYAPNTYKELKLAQMRKAGKPIPELAHEPLTVLSAGLGQSVYYTAMELWGIVLGPYLVIHFILTPAVYYLVGHAVQNADIDFDALQGLLGFDISMLQTYWTSMLNMMNTSMNLPDGNTMFWNAVTNFFWAELLTNLHSFCVVVPNHAGDDMYRFAQPCRPFSGSFYLRQVIASVDMSYGNDVVDFMHGWLNYQIEHHLWPNLSMLQYQRAAPRVRQICAKYGVPYIQENSFVRVKKTLDIMVGKASMPWFPPSYETHFLQLDAAAETAKSQ